MEVKDLVIYLREFKYSFAFNDNAKLCIVEDEHCLCVYDKVSGRNYHYPWANVISYSFTTVEEESK